MSTPSCTRAAQEGPISLQGGPRAPNINAQWPQEGPIDLQEATGALYEATREGAKMSNH